MRLVSDQSAEEIRRQRLRDALVYRLREFAANLLRTIRGAGQPRHLAEQMEKCVTAMQQYTEAHGHMPSEQLLHEILDCDTATSTGQ
jgi:hypothetical protein